jgi:hypothetical protein
MVKKMHFIRPAFAEHARLAMPGLFCHGIRPGKDQE